MSETLFELPVVEKTSFGTLMGKGMHKRREHDFYPTADEEAITSLVEVIGEGLEGWSVMTGRPIEVHEPACGEGHMSKVLERFWPVLSTDLIDRGYGQAGVDYLTCKETRPIVITNPPFHLAREFVEKALADGAERVYLLLKATYWHAARRTDLFEGTPHSRIMPLSWRLDFTGEGSPPMECCWFEWIRGYQGLYPKYGPILKRPKINPDKCKNTIELFE